MNPVKPLQRPGLRTNRRTNFRTNRVAKAWWPLIALALWPAPVPAFEADELFQRVAPAVVLITVSDGLGRNYGSASGVVVAPGEIVTNCHVIAGATRIAVTQSAGGKVAQASKSPFRSRLPAPAIRQSSSTDSRK